MLYPVENFRIGLGNRRIKKVPSYVGNATNGSQHSYAVSKIDVDEHGDKTRTNQYNVTLFDKLTHCRYFI